MGSYWGFREGAFPAHFDDFGFLIKKNDPNVMREDNLIAYEIASFAPPLGTHFGPPSATDIATCLSVPSLVPMLLGKLIREPAGSFNNSRHLAGDTTYHATKITMGVRPVFGQAGQPGPWVRGSQHAFLDSANPLETFDVPNKIMYLTGQEIAGAEPDVGFGGILGTESGNRYTTAGSYAIVGTTGVGHQIDLRIGSGDMSFTPREPGVLASPFYDHAHEIFTPYMDSSPAANQGSPVKVASLTSNYYFAEAEYDAAIKGDDVNERYLPNLYMLQEAIVYSPRSMQAAQLPNPGAPPTRKNPHLAGIARLEEQQVVLGALQADIEVLNNPPNAAQDLTDWRASVINWLDGAMEGQPPGLPEGSPWPSWATIPGIMPIPQILKKLFWTYDVAEFHYFEGQTGGLEAITNQQLVAVPPWYGQFQNAKEQGIRPSDVGSQKYIDWLFEAVINPTAIALAGESGADTGLSSEGVEYSQASSAAQAFTLQLATQTRNWMGLTPAQIRDIYQQDPAIRALLPIPRPLDFIADEAGASLIQAISAIVWNQVDLWLDWLHLDLQQRQAIIAPVEAEFEEQLAVHTLEQEAYDAEMLLITEHNEKVLSSGMYGVYNTLSTFGAGFMPSTLAQVARAPYTMESGEAWKRAKTTYLKKFTNGIKNFSAGGAGEVFARNSHIGFSRDFMETKFNTFAPGTRGAAVVASGVPSVLPYNINIKFNTRLMAAESTNTFGVTSTDVFLRGMDGRLRPQVQDFLLHNIMLCNIASGGPAGLDREIFAEGGNIEGGPFGSIPAGMDVLGEAVYKATYEFSAKISDIDTGEQYYGFEWAENTATALGVGAAAGVQPGWGGSLTADPATGIPAPPKYSSGPYNLKIMDVPLMLGYCAAATNASSDNRRNIPNPQRGQDVSPNVCLAFGKGIFVGNQEINTTTDPTAFTPPTQMVLDPPNFNWLIEELSDLVVRKQRSFDDILNGQLAYSEIIGFKVEKYRVGAPGSAYAGRVATDPVQSFYFPNQFENNIISYYDTQVKYGALYYYKVYAYTLVIGDRYNYNNYDNDMASMMDPAAWSNWSSTGLGGGGAAPPQATVNQWPSIQIIEEPYVDLGTIMVADLPPPMPEIEVVPFRAINNKIRFLIQRQEGSYTLNPDNFVINAADIDEYNRMRLAQYGGARIFAQNVANNVAMPILFGVDNIETVTFEIYRIDTKPTSYRDFEGALLAMPEAITPDGKRATEYAYDDTSILPNKKYYYTFRSVDPHGQISNATPIYEIELVDDNGRIYPIVNIVSLAARASRTTTTKPLRKLLQIDAAFPQQAVNTTAIDSATQGPSAPPPSPVLNTQPEGIWTPLSTTSVGSTPLTDEKVFKIRVTSKHTGKKLDLNVRFMENPIANPHEQD
jgi:hypothetical protein